ncbi:VOC family protein [Miniphocaeibacter massiliensis]|uniref:VOC family protein n=1 Tax=Miniphocaeibacter massiliensis TaxID=2041841 RepID=UPI000C1BD3B3|nr:VOC family protein [Miniphocaeibacter massiliensis]
MFKSMVPNLMVENVNETIDFYKNILSFSVVTSVPNDSGGLQFAILTKDDFSLMIQEKSNFIKEYPSLTMDKVKPSISLYIQVDNLKILYEELKLQYLILVDVHTTFYGSKEFAIEDNNGYILTFTEYINN